MLTGNEYFSRTSHVRARIENGRYDSRVEIARRYYVAGRVQGVGFRCFVERAAADLGVSGYASNLDDGRVEVYAVGTPRQIAELQQRLRAGPRLADVRDIEEHEAAVEKVHGFSIRRG